MISIKCLSNSGYHNELIDKESLEFDEVKNVREIIYWLEDTGELSLRFCTRFKT